MASPVNTIMSDLAYIASRFGLQVNTVYMWTNSNKQWPQPFSQIFNRQSVHTALNVSGHWVYKMIDCGRIGKRPLCSSQINSKNARVSQTIDCKAGDRMEEVTVKIVSTVSQCDNI